jgi:hypothetical protein
MGQGKPKIYPDYVSIRDLDTPYPAEITRKFPKKPRRRFHHIHFPAFIDFGSVLSDFIILLRLRHSNTITSVPYVVVHSRIAFMNASA